MQIYKTRSDNLGSILGEESMPTLNGSPPTTERTIRDVGLSTV
ncbi:hypothetical protein M595_0524 [Lyngbya aestuarii BL J]|uniref:Uncharacterized protein n=1 Tax=Lyngbya aestuarii BL J TaxID=1348334 RepID=U7QNF3_9CYAN|nr:hypothetical protein M595_0524 [Lyngbya aestuarii BL J]